MGAYLKRGASNEYHGVCTFSGEIKQNTLITLVKKLIYLELWLKIYILRTCLRSCGKEISCTPDKEILDSSRKHTYIILTPLNPPFI